MHRMTRDAQAAEIRAPFDGATLRFKSDTITLETREGQRYVRLARPGVPGELYRVTRVIGGRQREDFVGVRVQGAKDVGQSEELVLPVSYLLFAKRLRYKGYSVQVHERPFAVAGPVWEETCIFCHNTVPFFATILGALAGPRAPHYQGVDVDALLPDARRWRWSIADGRALEGAAHEEGARLGVDVSDVRGLIGATRARFGAKDVVELGIGCEACHNGARAHVEDPSRRPSFTPESPLLSLTTTPARDAASSRAQAIDRVCARCHQVLFSRYPWTWEGRKRGSTEPGGSTINSGEARDLLLGGCASALACTACHDPHDARDRRAREAALATPAGNGVCTSCHAAYANEAALRAHAHHDPRGAGGACVACHMPRKNMGLDTRLTRYHRIGSPTDPERVLLDRPLECALCHAKASIESLTSAMERWWNKAYPRQELARLYGDDLGVSPLVATLARGKPHEQAVAASVLGEVRDRAAAPLLARELVNEYPIVRAFAARALADAIGKDCGIDVSEETSRIARDAHACLAAAGLPDPVWPPLGAAPSSGADEVPED